MKRIYVPTRSGLDWQPLLAKPNLHWKQGASAMTTAARWEAAADALPIEIAQLLDASNDRTLMGLNLLAAFPEWSVSLPGGTTTSQTDVLAVCRNDCGLCVIGVEAKVLEPFGPTIGEKRAAASPGQVERMAYLEQLLGVERFDNTIRYQLLHRTASALLTAQAFHAATAVMLVHAFDTPQDRREDFAAFCRALDAVEVGPMLYRVESKTRLFLAWCDGDAEFRKTRLSRST